MTTDTGSARQQHLKWCKERALAELESSGCGQALASMQSDLFKSESYTLDPVIWQGLLIEGARLVWADDRKGLAHWIEGFN